MLQIITKMKYYIMFKHKILVMKHEKIKFLTICFLKAKVQHFPKTIWYFTLVSSSM